MPLPFFFTGKVVHGYGRGGRTLDCPTANLDNEAVSSIGDDVQQGVYIGYARINNGELYPMVMSIGYNVQFGNNKKTAEVHLLHQFENDFYGARLSAVAIQFLRPMLQFIDIDHLKNAIANDKKEALTLLTDEKKTHWKSHSYFTTTSNSTGAPTNNGS